MVFFLAKHKHCNLNLVEETIGLYFLLKILIKDQDLIPEAAALCLDYLEQINFGPKSYLKDITQIIIKVLDENSDPERDIEVKLFSFLKDYLIILYVGFKCISSE